MIIIYVTENYWVNVRLRIHVPHKQNEIFSLANFSWVYLLNIIWWPGIKCNKLLNVYRRKLIPDRSSLGLTMAGPFRISLGLKKRQTNSRNTANFYLKRTWIFVNIQAKKERRKIWITKFNSRKLIK